MLEFFQIERAFLLNGKVSKDDMVISVRLVL